MEYLPYRLPEGSTRIELFLNHSHSLLIHRNLEEVKNFLKEKAIAYVQWKEGGESAANCFYPADYDGYLKIGYSVREIDHGYELLHQPNSWFSSPTVIERYCYTGIAIPVHKKIERPKNSSSPSLTGMDSVIAQIKQFDMKSLRPISEEESTQQLTSPEVSEDSESYHEDSSSAESISETEYEASFPNLKRLLPVEIDSVDSILAKAAEFERDNHHEQTLEEIDSRIKEIQEEQIRLEQLLPEIETLQESKQLYEHSRSEQSESESDSDSDSDMESDSDTETYSESYSDSDGFWGTSDDEEEIFCSAE